LSLEHLGLNKAKTRKKKGERWWNWEQRAGITEENMCTIRRGKRDNERPGYIGKGGELKKEIKTPKEPADDERQSGRSVKKKERIEKSRLVRSEILGPSTEWAGETKKCTRKKKKRSCCRRKKKKERKRWPCICDGKKLVTDCPMGAVNASRDNRHRRQRGGLRNTCRGFKCGSTKR